MITLASDTSRKAGGASDSTFGGPGGAARRIREGHGSLVGGWCLRVTAIGANVLLETIAVSTGFLAAPDDASFNWLFRTWPATFKTISGALQGSPRPRGRAGR